MEQTPERDNIKYSILTNALMLKEFAPRVPYVIRNLNELGVSIDGATKDTYEKMRLGGRWEKINENLEYISELKDKHGFKFIMHFVVQKNNYHEMEDIVMLGEKYNADRVWFSRIQDWNTWGNFSEHNIFSVQHPQHSDYRIQLDKLVKLNSKIVEEATLRQLH
jgi:MoaA/NifB/PqqE/SkfB family radical SAM enzyme